MNLSILGLIAISYVGTPYIYGGNRPLTGLDCSGLVQIPLKKVGILPNKKDHYSIVIHDELVKLGFISSEPCQDCILFFGKNGRITHVSIALDETWMVEARGGNGVTTSRNVAEMQNALTEITRIDHRKDLIASIKVHY